MRIGRVKVFSGAVSLKKDNDAIVYCELVGTPGEAKAHPSPGGSFQRHSPQNLLLHMAAVRRHITQKPTPMPYAVNVSTHGGYSFTTE